jgi:hypothetical protein
LGVKLGVITVEYGQGYKQRKIIELGKNDQLTFGTLIDLYGYAKSLDELAKLEDLGLVVIDEDTLENDEINYSTKLRWLDTV